ncbi:MAG: hypothetical protein GY866_00400 [Proteobacteria bacterium]|nr:hypothetical protein [Pseudomonadota bacterium]
MTVTALNPHLGYENAARIAKKAFADNLTLREAAIELDLMEGEAFDEVVRPEKMVGTKWIIRRMFALTTSHGGKNGDLFSFQQSGSKRDEIAVLSDHGDAGFETAGIRIPDTTIEIRPELSGEGIQQIAVDGLVRQIETGRFSSDLLLNGVRENDVDFHSSHFKGYR